MVVSFKVKEHYEHFFNTSLSKFLRRNNITLKAQSERGLFMHSWGVGRWRRLCVGGVVQEAAPQPSHQPRRQTHHRHHHADCRYTLK
jgi:hypothetical protein